MLVWDMQPDFSIIQSVLLAAIVVWAVYRRVRRSFGRQLLAPKRMWIRIGLLLLVGALLAPAALATSAHLAASIGALAAGVALGLWGASETKLLDADGKRYYLPHTYTGLIVTLLVVGRLVYRLSLGLDRGRALAGAAGAHAGAAAAVQTPLTLAALYLLIGYYVCYFMKVLAKTKHPAPTDFESAAETRPPS